jgi:hypothetical protein
MLKRPTHKPTRWVAYLMHGKNAGRLGEVEADSEAEALTRAWYEFRIRTDWQKRRVFVRRVTD